MRRRPEPAALRLIAIIAAAYVWAAVPRSLQATTTVDLLRMDDRSATQPVRVELTQGGSSVLEFPDPIERASVNNEVVASLVVVSPTQILVHGRSPGSTTMIVWRAGESHVYQITVAADIQALQEAVARMFPGEPIAVYSAEEHVVLAGEVSSQDILEDTIELALPMSGEKLIPLLHVKRRPLADVLPELFPGEHISVVETHNGIILKGEVSTGRVASQVMSVAQTYACDVTTDELETFTRTTSSRKTKQTGGSAVFGRSLDADEVEGETESSSETSDCKVTNLLTVSERTVADLLRSLMPGETFEVHERKQDQAIVLAGKASHPANKIKAEAVAKAFYEENKVVNIIDLADPRQVLIEVRFAEVDRSVTNELGLDYFVHERDLTDAGFVGGLISSFEESAGGSELEFAPTTTALNHLLQLRGSTGSLTLALKALEAEGLIRVLAEPNLLAMSGEEASFLAGGEFPIPIAQGLTGVSTVTIVFKEFGIKLKFIPTVTSDDEIVMKVEPEVSVLDFATAPVTLQGFTVPGLITRRASTTVQMRPGETFAIGGLLSQRDTKTDRAIPYVSHIPILGELFKSESFKKDETELLVLVTPRLRAPSSLTVQERYPDPAQIERTAQEQIGEPPYPHAQGDSILKALGYPVQEPAAPEGVSAPGTVAPVGDVEAGETGEPTATQDAEPAAGIGPTDEEPLGTGPGDGAEPGPVEEVVEPPDLTLEEVSPADQEAGPMQEVRAEPGDAGVEAARMTEQPIVEEDAGMAGNQVAAEPDAVEPTPSTKRPWWKRLFGSFRHRERSTASTAEAATIPMIPAAPAASEQDEGAQSATAVSVEPITVRRDQAGSATGVVIEIEKPHVVSPEAASGREAVMEDTLSQTQAVRVPESGEQTGRQATTSGPGLDEPVDEAGYQERFDKRVETLKTLLEIDELPDGPSE